MVSGLGLAPMIDGAVAFAAAATREQLPPPTRAAVLMALLGFALVGMLLVVIILLGGHWVRRQGNFRRGPVVPPDRNPIAAPTATLAGSPLDASDATSVAETVISHTTRRGQKKAP